MAALHRRERVGPAAILQRVDVMRQDGRREMGLDDPRRARKKRRLTYQVGILRAARCRNRGLAVDAEIPREIPIRRRKMIGLGQRHCDGETQQSFAFFQHAARDAKRVRAHVRYASA